MQNEPMNLHLDDLALFVRVAELGTLSAAARERARDCGAAGAVERGLTGWAVAVGMVLVGLGCSGQ